MALTLFHSPQTRSTRFIWLLEEIGAPYELRYVDIVRSMSGGGAEDPANPNPSKKVPYLVHDGRGLGESVAIAIYLGDAFPEAGLAPAIGDPKRGPYLQWLAFYLGEIEPMLFAAFRKDDSAPMVRQREQTFATLNRGLETGPYLLGEMFSVADVLIASSFGWAADMLPKGPHIDAYLQRINARPAVHRAAAKDAKPQ